MGTLIDAMKAAGLIADQRKDYTAALNELKQALRIDPRDASIHYMLGNILREKEESDETVMHYQEALRIDPQFAEAYNSLGNLMKKKAWLKKQ